jgi:P4 family phage/plasmid primase-like protien
MDFKLIGNLCQYGVDFAPTAAGMTRSNVRGWQHLATTDKQTIKNWFKEDGHGSLVAVAKRGHAAILDIDDKAACLGMGFKPEWFLGGFGVATPSGGEHWYFRQDASLEGLRSVVNVHAVKADRDSKKILELKIDRCSVAAPSAKRENQPNKADGIYTPITALNGHLPTIRPELLAWILQHAEAAKQHFSTDANADWRFHPTGFSVGAFCEDNHCSEYVSGMLDERTFVIVPEECPLCGHAHNGSTLAAGVTKFFFSGRSYGFTCKACGVETRDEYEEKMGELYDDFDAWSGYAIYEHEDEELIQQKDEIFLKSLGISTDSPEPMPAAESEPALAAKVKTVKTTGFSYNSHDTGNGERLVMKFGQGIRYVEEIGEWMVWTRHGWKQDTSGTLMRYTKAVLDDLYSEARDSDGNVNAAKLKHAMVSGSITRRKAMIESAGFEEGVHTNIWKWDADPWLLNVQNGVIDLKTQTLRERTPDDLCRKQASVAYDPNADCRSWKAAMRKYSNNDPSWVEFVQCAVGVSLTSYQGLQMVFFCQGGGENGKDAFMSTLRQLFGSYAKDVAFTTFCERKFGHSEARDDLAALAGATRFVTSAETSDGHTLDEQVIKLVTGGIGSKVSCRHLYGKWFDYSPEFHLWFMSNYEPVVKGGDWGIWRRVVKIPWDWDFSTDPDKDPEFAEKIKAELPGILNWALDGLRKFLAAGKKMPVCQRITDATAQYRQEMDIVGRFVSECLEFTPDYCRVTAKDVYRVYAGWAKANGHGVMNSRRFNADLKKRLGSKVSVVEHTKSGLVYERVVLKANDRGEELEDWGD